MSSDLCLIAFCLLIYDHRNFIACCSMFVAINNIGSLCADTLAKHQEEFAPFCEYTNEISTFDEYVEKVRNSAEWGGHLELRALGIALGRPIYVYSVQSGAKPLAIHEDTDNETKMREPILLSYHLHYYALGEHYNQVVKD